MTKAFDTEKADAALKRAARIAVSGTREARSGRFVPRPDSPPRDDPQEAAWSDKAVAVPPGRRRV